MHIRKEHGEEEVQKAFPPKITQGEHSCHLCPFKSNFRTNLRKHIKRKHGPDELKLRKDLEARWFSVGSISRVINCMTCYWWKTYLKKILYKIRSPV